MDVWRKSSAIAIAMEDFIRAFLRPSAALYRSRPIDCEGGVKHVRHAVPIQSGHPRSRRNMTTTFFEGVLDSGLI